MGNIIDSMFKWDGLRLDQVNDVSLFLALHLKIVKPKP